MRARIQAMKHVLEQGKQMMNRNFKPTTSSVGLALTCVAFLAAPAAFAHDIWVTTDKHADQYKAQINFGDVDKRELVDLKKIVTLDLVTASGSTDLRRPMTEGQRLGAPIMETAPFKAAPDAVIAVSYDNGFWLTRPNDQKETNTSPLMEPKGLDPHWTVKYGKTLLGPGSSAQMTHARGEFVLLKDPYTLAVGQKLPVRLVIDGKPVAGTRVRYSDGIEPLSAEKVPFVKTDKDGMAEIPLERKGAYMIASDPTVPPTHPALSSGDHVFVALSFDLAQ